MTNSNDVLSRKLNIAISLLFSLGATTDQDLSDLALTPTDAPDTMPEAPTSATSAGALDTSGIAEADVSEPALRKFIADGLVADSESRPFDRLRPKRKPKLQSVYERALLDGGNALITAAKAAWLKSETTRFNKHFADIEGKLATVVASGETITQRKLEVELAASKLEQVDFEESLWQEPAEGETDVTTDTPTPPATDATPTPPATGATPTPPATGATPTPPATGATPTPPATGSTPVPPAAKPRKPSLEPVLETKWTMTDAAQGATYAQMLDAGWTHEAMVEHAMVTTVEVAQKTAENYAGFDLSCDHQLQECLTKVYLDKLGSLTEGQQAEITDAIMAATEGSGLVVDAAALETRFALISAIETIITPIPATF